LDGIRRLWPDHKAFPVSQAWHEIFNSPLIGGGGVAEMGRMVEFHTDLTAVFERESGGPATLRFGSHKLTVHDASSCVTGKNQRRKECHENEE
jgi:hypothetical protein